MDLVGAHDILRPGCTNNETLKDFLASLEAFQCLANCNPKQLQEFSSRIKECLNNKSQIEKYNGLCALEVLVQQCSPDFLSDNIGSFVNCILNQILKCQQVEPQLFNRACQVLAKIIENAPSLPDISRQLSSLATTIITCMIEVSYKSNHCQIGVQSLLFAIMSNYPGACGAVTANIKGIEEVLVKNMVTQDPLVIKQVTGPSP